jgi:dynein light chain LC8-type
MLEGKGVVRETDMAEEMQNKVMELAHQALDAHEVSDCQSIAHFIKQVSLYLQIKLKFPLLKLDFLYLEFFFIFINYALKYG